MGWTRRDHRQECKGIEVLEDIHASMFGSQKAPLVAKPVIPVQII